MAKDRITEACINLVECQETIDTRLIRHISVRDHARWFLDLTIFVDMKDNEWGKKKRP